jgi:hypothetical protein
MQTIDSRRRGLASSNSPTGTKTIPIISHAAMTYLGSRRGCHDLILCCVNAVSEGMRLATSAAGLAAPAAAAVGEAAVDAAETAEAAV